MALLLKCYALVSLLSICSLGYSATEMPKKKIGLGNKTILVEVADTSENQQKGLMFRTSLMEDEGMLFIFKNEETRFFWMKNTLIDLSIGFFDKNKTLVDVQEMTLGQNIPDSALPSYASAHPAMYALEMNKGWFDRNKVKIGTKLKIH